MHSVTPFAICLAMARFILQVETDDPSERGKIICLRINAGKINDELSVKTNYPSRRTIHIVRLFRRTCLRNSS